MTKDANKNTSMKFCMLTRLMINKDMPKKSNLNFFDVVPDRNYKKVL